MKIFTIFTGEIGRIDPLLKGDVSTPSHLPFDTLFKRYKMDEIWKDVPGYEGYYQVSNIGNVKSLDRVVSHKRYNKEHVSEKILSPKKHGGYLSVRLCGDGKRKLFLVHRVVMLAFVGNPSKEQIDINHKNSNKKDNRLINLEYCTRSENIKHSYLNGTHPSGEDHHNSKFTNKERKEIYLLKQKGYTLKQIINIFPASSSTIWYIIDNYARKNKNR